MFLKPRTATKGEKLLLIVDFVTNIGQCDGRQLLNENTT